MSAAKVVGDLRRVFSPTHRRVFLPTARIANPPVARKLAGEFRRVSRRLGVFLSFFLALPTWPVRRERCPIRASRDLPVSTSGRWRPPVNRPPSLSSGNQEKYSHTRCTLGSFSKMAFYDDSYDRAKEGPPHFFHGDLSEAC